MSFMSYSLECLGGRVQWIPFQHLMHNVIRNQMYIHRDNNRKHFKKYNFNAVEHIVNTSRTTLNDNDTVVDKLLTFDYEDISVTMKCVPYCTSYQFSSQTLSG
eukprot:799581_1